MTQPLTSAELTELVDIYRLGAGPGTADVLAPLVSSADRPVTLVNLFALHERARYETDEDEPAGTGAEAMLRYGALSGPLLESVGGRFVHRGLATATLWGDGGWDVVVVAEYPSAAAVIELLCDPGYRDAFRHRRAAVARQIVTASVSLD